jgi:fucose permease
MKSSLVKQTNLRIGLILLAYLAFIALGMPDGLLGVGWPSIRASFSLPLDALGMLLIASMSGYISSSFASGALLSRLGVGKVLALSCALTGAGLIGYTLVPSWWMMVALGVCAGLGAGAIDTGLNTYMAANFGEGLMQWLHASYGVGITLGPVIMTVAVNSFNSWRTGYTVVGLVQLILAFCFTLTLPLWVSNRPSEGKTEQNLIDYKTPLVETLRRPAVWLSAFLFFVYVGAEASLGAWAYTLLTESRGIASTAAGFWAGSYWATFTIGRVLAGLFARRVGVDRLVWASLTGALLGAVLLWWNPAEAASLGGVALIGFAIAPVFPALVSGTSRRVTPRYAANTIGMQMVASSLGAALVPGLVGVLADQTSLEIIPLCLFTLFAILSLFYLASTRLRRRRESSRA